ncbi:MAG: hypothetical protein WCC17_24930 [Candidatus Nitrosopolaris sp.]
MLIIEVNGTRGILQTNTSGHASCYFKVISENQGSIDNTFHLNERTMQVQGQEKQSSSSIKEHFDKAERNSLM